MNYTGSTKDMRVLNGILEELHRIKAISHMNQVVIIRYKGNNKILKVFNNGF